jgi:hypothetical protein
MLDVGIVCGFGHGDENVVVLSFPVVANVFFARSSNKLTRNALLDSIINSSLISSGGLELIATSNRVGRGWQYKSSHEHGKGERRVVELHNAELLKTWSEEVTFMKARKEMKIKKLFSKRKRGGSVSKIIM